MSPRLTAAQRVGIYLFDGMEALDFAGPFEVFTTAARMAERAQPGRPPCFEVVGVASRMAPVRARAGLNVLPDHGIHHHPPLDLLIVPGGVVEAEQARPEVLAWIAQQASQVACVASVCTGAFLLAQAGLLAGRPATTHWEDLDELRRQFPGLDLRTQQRWVDTGPVVTSAGISAGIDMSLHLVARFAGRPLAERTARQMDFDWTENA